VACSGATQSAAPSSAVSPTVAPTTDGGSIGTDDGTVADPDAVGSVQRATVDRRAVHRRDRPATGRRRSRV
jgi:hypothetical protein